MELAEAVNPPRVMPDFSAIGPYLSRGTTVRRIVWFAFLASREFSEWVLGNRDMSDESFNDEFNDQGTAEFLRLYSAHQSRIFAYIFTLLPNWHDSEEVFQEMSVVLWRAFESFTPGTDFRSWAFKVALNQVLTYRKRNKRAAVLLGPEVMEAIAGEVNRESAALDSQLAALAGCVEKLPPRNREILDRCYQPGARTRQVAQELGRPEGTIYKSLTRIRQWLFDCIQKTVSMEQGR